MFRFELFGYLVWRYIEVSKKAQAFLWVVGDGDGDIIFFFVIFHFYVKLHFAGVRNFNGILV